MFECEKCGAHYNCGEGIIAEIEDNKIVFTSCSPFTRLYYYCDKCVKILNIVENIKKKDNKNEYTF